MSGFALTTAPLPFAGYDELDLVRKVKEGETTTIFWLLTTEPNDVVGASIPRHAGNPRTTNRYG